MKNIFSINNDHLSENQNLTEASCACLHEPMPFDQYNPVRHIGIDKTNGRFGEVNLWQCKLCGRYWLHYLLEYEAFPASGRYFMGLIKLEIADALSPEKAIDYLDSLDWHLYGGSYFAGKGKSTNKLNTDIW
jgi:hypothetical protein